ncbi:MAG: FxsA family protein [Hyphomicrobiaceae bacterium]
MSLAWLLLLIAWPLIEIAVLIKAGNALGFWWTLGIVIATGLIGTAVLMRHGLKATYKVQEAMARGETPLAPMMDGALVATAGILLITPGLCADAVGLVLMLPPLRQFLARLLLQRVFGLSEVDGRRPGPRAKEGGPQAAGPEARRGWTNGSGEGPVIEGEFERLEERTVDPKRRPPPEQS